MVFFRWLEAGRITFMDGAMSSVESTGKDKGVIIANVSYSYLVRLSLQFHITCVTNESLSVVETMLRTRYGLGCS